MSSSLHPLEATLTLSRRRGSRRPPSSHYRLPQKDELRPPSPGPVHRLGNGCDRVAWGSALHWGCPRGLRTRPLTCKTPPGPEAFSSSPLCPVAPKAFLWFWWAMGTGSLLIPTGSGLCQPQGTGGTGLCQQTPPGNSHILGEWPESTGCGQG